MKEFISDVFDTIRNQVRDPKRFDSLVKESRLELELSMQVRLCKCLQVILDNQHKQPLLFNPFIFSFFELFQAKNNFLATLSNYEFSTSFRLLEIIYNQSTFITFDKEQDVKYFIIISAILAKYPGMQVRSARKAVCLLTDSGTITQKRLDVFFEYLFVKYENPVVFTQYICLLTDLEIDMLMFVFQGNNLRNYPKLPFPISKKESFFLINTNPLLFDFELKDQFYLRALMVAKLLIARNNQDNLKLFINHCRTFQYKLRQFYVDFDFWREAYLLIDVKEFGYTLNQDMLDYLQFMKQENASYSLKGRTSQLILKAMQKWHLLADFGELARKQSMTWIEKPNTYTIKHQETEYKFKEIGNGKELMNESIEMSHCAFSYIDSCMHMWSTIWSLMITENGSAKRLLTIEVAENKVVQVRGKYNRLPMPNELMVLEKWCNEMKYEYFHL